MWEEITSKFSHRAISRSTPSEIDLSGHPTFEFIPKLALFKEGTLPKEQNTVLQKTKDHFNI